MKPPQISPKWKKTTINSSFYDGFLHKQWLKYFYRADSMASPLHLANIERHAGLVAGCRPTPRGQASPGVNHANAAVRHLRTALLFHRNLVVPLGFPACLRPSGARNALLMCLKSFLAGELLVDLEYPWIVRALRHPSPDISPVCGFWLRDFASDSCSRPKS